MPDGPSNGSTHGIPFYVVAATLALLISFFGWLAFNVVEIKVTVARMDERIESLTRTRASESQERERSLTDRLGRLEEPLEERRKDSR